MQPQIVYREETSLAQNCLRLFLPSVLRNDRRPNRAAVRFRALQLHLQPVPASRHIVPQQRGRLIEIDDHHVHIPVVIEIAERAPAAGVRRRHARTGAVHQLLELPATQISKDHPRRLVGIRGNLRLQFRINAPSGEEQIRQPVVIQVQHGGSPAGVPRLHSQPRRHGHVVEIPLPVVAVEHAGVVAEVRLEDVQIAVQVVVADRQAHPRLFHPVSVQRHSAFQPDIRKRSVVIVAQQETRRRIAGNIEVGPAIVVEIRRYRGQRIASLRLDEPRRRRHVRECFIPVVAIEFQPARRQTARPAGNRHSLPVARGRFSQLRHRVQIEVHVVRHQQIQQSVAVVVHERAPGSPDWRGGRRGGCQSRLRGDVGECPVSVVPI